MILYDEVYLWTSSIDPHTSFHALVKKPPVLPCGKMAWGVVKQV